MALVLEQFVAAEIGDASYLVGDDSEGVAAVIDPQVDVERYVSAARSRGLAVTQVLQTHIHEDFVSGAVALAKACGDAAVCVSGHDAPEYGFPHRLIHDGDVIALGGVHLTVKHTPGHTPEHISLLVAKKNKGNAPFAVLSGGSLLVETAGRTDLLGQEQVDKLTHDQFETLHKFYSRLDEGVVVYPTHVHGSPCGAAIGDRACTTVGYERRHNPLLQPNDDASFEKAALGNLPPKPRYYPRLKERNISDPPRSGPPTALRGLTAGEFQSELERGNSVLLDTRHLLAFGGSHIPGAVNIGATGHLSIWAGWMLPPDKPLLLVLDSDSKLATVVVHLARTGFESFAGYLVGGMSAWENAGLPLRSLPQLHVEDACRQWERGTLQLVDVRSPQEWQNGHAPGALRVFLPDLPTRYGMLRKDQRIGVYCDSGYRASIGASLLQAQGFDVSNIPGSWQAWTARNLPVDMPGQ